MLRPSLCRGVLGLLTNLYYLKVCRLVIPAFQYLLGGTGNIALFIVDALEVNDALKIVKSHNCHELYFVDLLAS